jgi:hypothetical protein
MVTLALSQADAEQLIQVTETGLPYLALVTTSSHTDTDIGRLLDTRPPRPAVRIIRVTPSPSPTPTLTPTPAPTPSPSPTPRKGR